MRQCLSDLLVAAASRDPRLLLLTGDHGYALFDAFRAHHAGQFINAGIAEQNMVGVAAGLAKGGFHPIVYGLSAFVPIRVLEQIKLDVCYENLPVTFLGDGAGVVYSTLGASHQCNEDLAALRALPNLAIFSPCDRWELAACFERAMAWQGPVYIRLGKADLGDVHGAAPDHVDRLQPLSTGRGTYAIVATGSMVKKALAVADRLGAERFTVYSAPAIKPLDVGQVVEVARTHEAIFTLEEHSVIGGLGAAIAEVTSQEAPVRVQRIGIRDRFTAHAGSYASLLVEHGLDEAAIARSIAVALDAWATR